MLLLFLKSGGAVNAATLFTKAELSMAEQRAGRVESGCSSFRSGVPVRTEENPRHFP
ncbi:MAG: hypothetical protein FWE10_05975 [Rikenellaceae bacterium]|nr:hypothetical protein [Rikenellaceae bacterium]MCL2692953.1 hypothetical protein [Rikenellaceae bacterium]